MRRTSAGRSRGSPGKRGSARTGRRELRHSFVSIMSDREVPIETIADLVGHSSTAVTEEVYQLKPVITKGAQTMNTIFNEDNKDQVSVSAGSPFGSLGLSGSG